MKHYVIKVGKRYITAKRFSLLEPPPPEPWYELTDDEQRAIPFLNKDYAKAIMPYFNLDDPSTRTLTESEVEIPRDVIIV